MRHLPVGRGNKSMNIAILTDNFFLLRTESKSSIFQGFWVTWEVSRNVEHKQMWLIPHDKNLPIFNLFSTAQDGIPVMDGLCWPCMSNRFDVRWITRNYLIGRSCFTAYLLFFQRFLYFFPCLNLLFCVECCRSSSKRIVLGVASKHLHKMHHRISLRSLGGAQVPCLWQLICQIQAWTDEMTLLTSPVTGSGRVILAVLFIWSLFIKILSHSEKFTEQVKLWMG